MIDKWQEGYRKGFEDGYKLGKKSGDYFSTPDVPKFEPNKACRVCGMSFVDEMGRPKVMNYVCFHEKCPSKAVSYTTVLPTKSTFQDGLSYEEIYGSVVYQQNKKKEN